MNRIELQTRTDAAVTLVDDFLPEGDPVSVVIVKQQYYLHRGVAEPVPGASVAWVDTPWPDDAEGAGSPMLPSDLALHKPSTDVVVSAEAMSPAGEMVRTLDVLVSVGPVSRALRVTGPRVWYEAFGVMAPTPPEPFTRLPLRWEHAWGGCDTDAATGRFAEDARNPYGRGVCLEARRLVHTPAPRIEDPAAPVLHHVGPNAPVGVSATTPRMAHRRALVGTMDDRWQRTRMPLRPTDFDLRFFQCAAPGLVTPSPLVGGEAVRLVGLSADGPMAFALPRASFAVWGITDARRTEYRVSLDTVILQPNTRTLALVWRTRVPIPPGSAPRLRAVQVYAREVR